MERKYQNLIKNTGTRLQEYALNLIVENGNEKVERYGLLDREWQIISASLPLFLTGPHPQVQEVCNALEQFLEFYGRYDELLALNQQGEACALLTDDHYSAGMRAYGAGWVYYLRGQADPVLECANRANTYLRSANAGTRDSTLPISLLGLGHQLKKDYPAAIAAKQAVLSLHSSLSPESVDVAKALNSLAETERLQGDLDGAQRDCIASLRVAKAVGYSKGVAIYTGNLAELALDRGEWQEAENLARNALPLAEELHRQESITWVGWILAKALMKQNRRSEALPYARRSVEIFTKLGHPELENARKTLVDCESWFTTYT